MHLEHSVHAHIHFTTLSGQLWRIGAARVQWDTAEQQPWGTASAGNQALCRQVRTATREGPPAEERYFRATLEGVCVRRRASSALLAARPGQPAQLPGRPPK